MFGTVEFIFYDQKTRRVRIKKHYEINTSIIGKVSFRAVVMVRLCRNYTILTVKINDN